MINNLIELLEPYLPSQVPPLPNATVTVVEVVEQPSGLGRWIGNESRGGFAAVALKGTQFDTVIRFQVWAALPDIVNAQVATLQQQLLDDRNSLRAGGVLSFSVQETSSPQFEPALNGWTQTSDYKILFEYQFENTDGAESLITRVPIGVNNPFLDSTVVTGQFVRWDDLTANPLNLTGRTILRQLSAFVFTLPGSEPNGSVTLTRTFNGASGSAQVFSDLEPFIEAVAGPEPTTRHAQVEWGTLTDFLNALDDAGETVNLGDWNNDGLPDTYQPKVLIFEPAIYLVNSRDRLEVAYQDTAFNQSAVVYLRGV